MKKPHNARKDSFLASIPQSSILLPTCTLAKRCKFNFHYFDNSQDAGQDFSDWTHENIVELLKKLKNYSEKSLSEWQYTRIGYGKQNVLEVYGKFPVRSDFKAPKNVPHQASWARFRLEGDMRLIGFVIPEDFNHQEQNGSGYLFDSNTFYVTFLDENHNFYKTK